MKKIAVLSIALLILSQPVVSPHAQEASPGSHHPKVFVLQDDGLPFLGQENAPVTIDVFSDYQCPACKDFKTVIEQALEKYPYKLKVVFKNYPLPKHRYARFAAAAALAAFRQDKFVEFHDALFEEQARLDVPKIDEIAERLQLDLRKFHEDMNSEVIQGLIDRDLNEVTRSQVRFTPTVFVNGKQLIRRTPEIISIAIEGELAHPQRQY